ncbi:MAG: hypothetical protein AAB214_01610, partial [Fibrobacterota bacterium]
LAGLAGLEPGVFFKNVKELKRRELLQQRSVWVAILPHAIANGLAEDALEFIPRHRILDAFLAEGRERLLRSFARRLGYLNKSEAAKEIAKAWIAPGGMLGQLEELDSDRFSWFERIAPIAETEALLAFERALMSPGNIALESILPVKQHAVRLLVSLAFLPENFGKAVDLLRFLNAAYGDERSFKAVLDRYKALFALRFSGTMATPDAKIEYLQKLFAKAEAKTDRQIALSLAECGLEAIHPTYHHSYDFGLRVGAYGYPVKSSDDFQNWYRKLLEFLVGQILSDSWSATALKEILGKQFRSLWESAGLKDELEEVASRLSENGDWIDGYSAIVKLICFGRKYGGDRYTTVDFERLELLRKLLHPKNLISSVRLVVSPRYRVPIDEIEEYEGNTGEKLAQVDRSIESELLEVGRRLGEDCSTLEKLLPELMTSQFPRVRILFRGVIESVENCHLFWERLETVLRGYEPNSVNPYLVAGVVDGILVREPLVGCEVLDRMAHHSELGQVFPVVQLLMPFDDGMHRRLMSAVELGASPISSYQQLGLLRFDGSYHDQQLVEILESISQRDGGPEVVLEILVLRFHGLEWSDYRPSPEIVEYTQRFLTKILVLDDHKDYQISRLISIAFEKPEAEHAAIEFACRLAAIDNTNWMVRWLRQSIVELNRLQPRSILDGYLLQLDRCEHDGPGFHEHPEKPSSTGDYSPFDDVSDEQMEEWSSKDPEERYLRLSQFVRLYHYDSGRNRVLWRPFTHRMISHSRHPLVLLDQIFDGFRSGYWSGSRADIMECYVPLLEDLHASESNDIADWATGKLRLLREDIAEWRKHDDDRSSSSQRGFE